jgi:hypothetical protein
MERFVNTSDVPLNNTKPRKDGRIVGRNIKTITICPTRYGQCVAVQFDDMFEEFEKNRPPVFVIIKYYVSKHIQKKHKKNKTLAVCSSGGIVD